MALEQQIIDHLTKLAQLEPSSAERDALRNDLERIIAMVDTLGEVDTNAVKPLSNPLDSVQRLRPDTVTASENRDALMANAPEASDGYFLVPRVVE